MGTLKYGNKTAKFFVSRLNSINLVLMAKARNFSRWSCVHVHVNIYMYPPYMDGEGGELFLDHHLPM